MESYSNNLSERPWLLINWTDQYSVKVAKFDDQHKHLVQLINMMHDAMKSGKGKEVLKPTLEKLVKYTVEHFADEEREMKKSGYSGYLTHKYEHDKLTVTAKDLYNKVSKGETVLTMEVLQFLQDWLVNHIVKVDKQYVDHLCSAGVN